MENKKIVLKREGAYSYGRCDCCNRKFTRTTRGIVVGKGDDMKYYPNTCHSNDWAEEFSFLHPEGVKILGMVKLGSRCFQKACDNGTLIDLV